MAAHVEAASRAVRTFPGAGRQPVPVPAPPSCLWPTAHTEDLENSWLTEMCPSPERDTAVDGAGGAQHGWLQSPQGQSRAEPGQDTAWSQRSLVAACEKQPQLLPLPVTFTTSPSSSSQPHPGSVNTQGNLLEKGGNPAGRELCSCSRGCGSRWAGEAAAAAAGAGSNTPGWSWRPGPCAFLAVHPGSPCPLRARLTHVPWPHVAAGFS